MPISDSAASELAQLLRSGTGTGEREEQRRACCTSEAVPAPPGKAITSTEALKAGEV